MTESPPKIAPGLLLQHYRAIAELEEQHRSIKRRINVQRAQATSDGVDLGALKLMRSLEKLDEATATSRLTALRHYSNWCGFPIGQAQGLLFMQPTAAEILDHDLWISEQDGRIAAKAGVASDANPHDPGGQLAQRWDAGWHAATLETATPPPGRRGRPPGARNKPKASVVLSRLRRAAAQPQYQTASMDI